MSVSKETGKGIKKDVIQKTERSPSAVAAMEMNHKGSIKKQKTMLETQYDADSEMNESPSTTVDPVIVVVQKYEMKPNNVDENVSPVVAPTNRPATESKSRQNLKWNLRVIISNIYMKSEQRLPGARIPKCLHNTSLCVSKHRCSMLPDAPAIGIAQDLRNNLYNQQYDTYIDMLESMALQSVFPDEAVFDRLFDMMMVLTCKTLSMEELANRYTNVLRVYYLLVDAFPPCWTALRPYYLDFLGVNNTTEQKPEKAQKVQLLLELLEECLDECTDTELSKITSYSEPFNIDYSQEENGSLSQDAVFMRHVQDYDWQSGKKWVDDFKKMSAGVRLARICDALDMIGWVLERQFLTWLDHNRLQQEEPDIFQNETQPFVFTVFGMTSETRLTPLTRQLLLLYSRGASQGLHPDRLNILQRFVSLIVEASNTADLKYVNNGLIYPSLGEQTLQLISEFFKIFKMENPTYISTYIKTIPLLNQPYLRFEFANLFLQLFYCTNTAPFGPHKVIDEFKAKQWLKYKPKNEQQEDEQLSREDYLKIMLNALQDYCLWLNLLPFWKYMKTKIPVQPLQANTNSPLATPVGVVTGEVGKILMLDEMQKEAHTWKHRINSQVIISKPKVNIPVARVSATKMAERYGSNLRELRYLRRIVQEVLRLVDVTEWVSFLSDFLGDDEPSSSVSD